MSHVVFILTPPRTTSAVPLRISGSLRTEEALHFPRRQHLDPTHSYTQIPSLLPTGVTPADIQLSVHRESFISQFWSWLPWVKAFKDSQSYGGPLSSLVPPATSFLPYTFTLWPHNFVFFSTILTPFNTTFLLPGIFCPLSSEKTLLNLVRINLNIPRSQDHNPVLSEQSRWVFLIASAQLYEKNSFTDAYCLVDLAFWKQKWIHPLTLYSRCPTKGLAYNRYNFFLSF